MKNNTRTKSKAIGKMNKIMISITNGFNTFSKWFIKIAKIINIKPKILLIILGLIAVILLSLGLGVNKKEGYSSMIEADSAKKKAIDDMNLAIDTIIRTPSDKQAFKTKVSNFYTKKKEYLIQQDPSMNDYDINKDRQIYKLRDELFDTSGNTLKQYVDNTPERQIDNVFLTKYTLTSLPPSISILDVDALRNLVTQQISLYNVIGKTKLTAVFLSFDKMIDTIHEYMTNSESESDYINILSQGSSSSYRLNITEDQIGESGHWKRKYEELMKEMTRKTNDITWNQQYLDNLTNTMGSDMANAAKWKELYLKELSKIKDFNAYVNSHNLRYHGTIRPAIQGQLIHNQDQTQTHSFSNLTGTTGNIVGTINNIPIPSNNIISNRYDGTMASNHSGMGNIPSGDEDLYMLKSRMVPPTSPAGGNTTANSGCCNSSPAPVPPCPPCDRCPEPAFDCKRVPKYNSASSSKYLPLPVLTDFSQFGM